MIYRSISYCHSSGAEVNVGGVFCQSHSDYALILKNSFSDKVNNKGKSGTDTNIMQKAEMRRN